MCMTCGCMMPENDMGNPDNITLGTIRKAAKAGGAKTVHDVMATMIKTYDMIRRLKERLLTKNR